jgi:hypothetical protein
MRGIMWGCWVGLCGVFVVGYELPLLWNNLLTPKKEIKNEIDPLWFIKIKQQNVDVCKWWRSNTWSKSVHLCKASTIHINLYKQLGFIQWIKYFPILFYDNDMMQCVTCNKSFYLHQYLKHWKTMKQEISLWSKKNLKCCWSEKHQFLPI